MWQRQTERAMQLVAFAEQEATRLGSNRVDPEHLLLALTRVPDSVAARVLERFGIPLDALAAEIEPRIPRDTDEPVGITLELAPASRAVLNSASDEARRFRDNYVGTEHFLLGLIRQTDTIASRALVELGADLERTRNEVRSTHDRDEEATALSDSIREQMRNLAVFRQAEELQSPETDDWSYVRALQALVKRSSEERSVRAAQANAVLAVELGRAACRKMFDLCGAYELTKEQAWAVIATARVLKETLGITKIAHRQILEGKTLAMVFERSALRTRVTCETGMFQLGGQAIHLEQGHMIEQGAVAVSDVTRSLETWVDGLLVRVFDHDLVRLMAEHSRVPVINGVSDQEHPCEALSAMLTVWERRGRLEGSKLAVVGNKRHIMQSLMQLGALMGMEVAVACPEGWAPEHGVLTRARQYASENQGSVAITHDVSEAIRGAHVIYTDAWSAATPDDDPVERERLLAGLQVNETVARLASPDFIFMHCLPARRGLEVTSGVIDGPHSVVFHQAENRIHAQKAIISILLGRSRRAVPEG